MRMKIKWKKDEYRNHIPFSFKKKHTIVFHSAVQVMNTQSAHADIYKWCRRLCSWNPKSIWLNYEVCSPQPSTHRFRINATSSTLLIISLYIKWNHRTNAVLFQGIRRCGAPTPDLSGTPIEKSAHMEKNMICLYLSYKLYIACPHSWWLVRLKMDTLKKYQ